MRRETNKADRRRAETTANLAQLFEGLNCLPRSGPDIFIERQRDLLRLPSRPPSHAISDILLAETRRVGSTERKLRNACLIILEQILQKRHVNTSIPTVWSELQHSTDSARTVQTSRMINFRNSNKYPAPARKGDVALLDAMLISSGTTLTS